MVKKFLTLLLLALIASPAMADVYQWQWVDPADHSLGKSQSTTLCPGGAGVIPGRGSVLGALDLTQAYLYSLDLSYSSWFDTTLNDAYFGKANIYQMLLYGCSAHNADFTAVQGMGHFRFCDLTGANFTDAKLKHFSFDTLDGVNFTRADLSNASFEQGTFHAANFTDANISGVHFYGVANGGFTQEQLHQTASFKSGDLNVSFSGGDDLSGWDFSGVNRCGFQGENLTGARFVGSGTVGFLNCNLSSADFSGARVTYLEANDLTGANFSGADLTGINAQSSRWTNANLTGAIIVEANLARGDDGALTQQQIYSTASYQTHDLHGVTLRGIDMTGWSFRDVNLTGANLSLTKLAGADLGNANLTNAFIYGSDGDVPLKGANISGAIIIGASLGPLTRQQLYSTASYQAHDLHGAGLSGDMSGFDFSGMNLSSISLATDANLAGADFTGARIDGARLGWDGDGGVFANHGLTPAQIYSTANYQDHELHGVRLAFFDLRGWDFRGIDLSSTNLGITSLRDADFAGANVVGANLFGADLRGVKNLNLAGANTINAIMPDGTVTNVNSPGWRIFNYEGTNPIPIHVSGTWRLTSGGQIHLVFDENDWKSIISFDPGMSITLANMELNLEIEDRVDPNLLVGRTFKIFDWTGVNLQSPFTFYDSLYQWDTSHLYTDGTVTLIGVPEPSTLSGALGVIALNLVVKSRRSAGRKGVATELT